jgi:hypothetical protein
MEHDKDGTPVLTPREARQGVRVRAQTLVLVLSMILAAVAAVALYAWGPGSQIDVPRGSGTVQTE